ncbi:MAG: IS4 family transposase [Betaproteobacteria bacterium]|nr:IS4 family transposase [Betaproteobacteria bacterium]
MVCEVTVDNKEDQLCVKIAKKRLREAVARFRRQFGDQPTRAMRKVLPADVLAAAVEEEVGAFRERVYPPMTTLGLFIGQALSPNGACQDAVARRLSERCARGEAGCSLSTGPYCKARQRLPLGLISRLAEAVGETLERASPRQWKWRGRSVKLLDGATVSMPNTPSNQSVYPQSGEQKPELGFPLAMLVGLISLATGAVLRWALGPCRGKHTSEQALFRKLLPYLSAEDVVLAARYHCNYFTVALLVERGVDLLTRQHQRRITDFRRGERLGRRDQLVQWQRPQRPSWVAGRILVTTLTDADSVSARELDALYSRRWQVEVDLRSIKAEMGMDILRANSADRVDKEIAVHLFAYNLVCALMRRAAAAAHVLARALSFKGTLQLLLAFQQHLRMSGGRSAKIMIAHLLGAISMLELPIRPGRIEPHAIKRRPKNHQLLTVPRRLARAAIARARGGGLR